MTAQQKQTVLDALLDTLREIDEEPIAEYVSQPLVDKVTEAARIMTEVLLND